MQRLNLTDPVSYAATQRLLVALILSGLVHGAVLSVASGTDSAATVPDITSRVVLPRMFTLSATLVTDPAVFDADMNWGLDDDRSGAANSLDTLDPRYYPVEELDVLPAPRKPIRQQPGTGELSRLRLLTRIDASGRINNVAVFDSDLTKAQNIAALQALRATMFTPARKDGVPVRSEVVIELGGGSGN